MDKLKPCPFCGSDDLHMQGNESNYVYYENCNTDGPDGKDKEEAIRRWNHAPRVGDNNCDYLNFTGGCNTFTIY